jgi:hypothetical protein
MPTKAFFRYICDLPVQRDGAARPDDGERPTSQTNPKFAISEMSPADGTIAARVAPLGIRHFPLAAQKQVTSFGLYVKEFGLYVKDL